MPINNWCQNKKTLIAVLVAVIILFGAFGAFFTVNPHEMGSSMPGCPFTEFGTSFCPLKVSDYLNSWRATFADTSTINTLMMIVVAFVVLLVASVLFNKFNVVRSSTHHPPGIKFKISIFGLSYLREVFSNGILHPKLYV